MRHHRSQKANSQVSKPAHNGERGPGRRRGAPRGNAARQDALRTRGMAAPAPEEAPGLDTQAAGGLLGAAADETLAMGGSTDAELEGEAGEDLGEEELEGEEEGGDSYGFEEADGPLGDPTIDGALSAAFGDDLGGIDAHFGETARNEALGAEAHAEGQRVSFGAGIQPGALDPRQLNTVAHEMAHALATHGGPEEEGVDQPGDKGEERADQAGRGFQRWAERGFAGEAPRLRAARGGRASIQRKAKTRASFDGTPALQRGSRGGQVSTLQTLLRRRGYTVAVDGDFGPATERAVRSFQSARGLTVDGVVGPDTARALRTAGKKKKTKKRQNQPDINLGPWLPLREGADSRGVSRLQTLLNRFKARVSVDGEFGPATERAVKAFQRANGLAVDGVVGPQTAAKLNSGSARDVKYSVGGGGNRKLPGRYLGKYAQYKGGRYAGTIKVVEMDGKKVALKTAYAWRKLKNAAKRDGVYLRLNSGFRTMAEQTALYRKYLAGTGNLAAPPGYSNHQNGAALDIDVSATSHYNWMHRNAPRYGWRRTVSSEPWHWEYFGS